MLTSFLSLCLAVSLVSQGLYAQWCLLTQKTEDKLWVQGVMDPFPKVCVTTAPVLTFNNVGCQLTQKEISTVSQHSWICRGQQWRSKYDSLRSIFYFHTPWAIDFYIFTFLGGDTRSSALGKLKKLKLNCNIYKIILNPRLLVRPPVLLLWSFLDCR